MPCVDVQKLSKLNFDWRLLLSYKADGWTADEIAKVMRYESGKVYDFEKAINRALGARNNLGALALATSLGLIDLSKSEEGVVTLINPDEFEVNERILLDLLALGFPARELGHMLVWKIRQWNRIIDRAPVRPRKSLTKRLHDLRPKLFVDLGGRGATNLVVTRWVRSAQLFGLDTLTPLEFGVLEAMAEGNTQKAKCFGLDFDEENFCLTDSGLRKFIANSVRRLTPR